MAGRAIGPLVLLASHHDEEAFEQHPKGGDAEDKKCDVGGRADFYAAEGGQ